MGVLTVDIEFYLNENPDVNTAIMNGTFTPVPGGSFAEQARFHYFNFGQSEGRDPNPRFDESFYLQQNEDVAAAVQNGVFDSGFDHFIHFGAREERLPSEAFTGFDEQAYLNQNEDVAAAVQNGVFDSGFQHFLLFGSAEGRLAPGANIDQGIPGETFELTRGFDEIEGTTNNDTFTAARVPEGEDGAPAQTLESFDELNGGGGSDRLNAALNGTDPISGNTTAPAIENIEQLFIRTRSEGNTLDMTAVSGAQQLWNDRSNQNLTFSGIQAAAVLGLNAVGAGVTSRAAYADDALGSTEFNQTVVAQGAGTAEAPVTLNVTSGANDAITGLTINAAEASNYIAASGELSDINELTVQGSGELSLSETANFEELNTVNAGGFTRDLNLNISGTDATDLSVITGAGNDRVVIDGSLLASEDLSIDLGGGNNTLALTGLTSEGDLDSVDFSLGDINGVSAVEFADNVLISGGGVDSLSLAGVEGSDLVFAGSVNSAGTPGTLAIEDSGASQSVTFESNVGTGTGVVLNFRDAEALTVNAGGAVSNTTITGAALDSLNLAAEEETVSVTVAGAVADESSISSLNVADISQAGNATFDLALTDTVDLTSIDLSALNGSFDEGGAFEGTDISINAAGADFANAVTIALGESGLNYNNAVAGVRETFQFGGTDIGPVGIDGFATGDGANRDRLDFSQFDDVNSLEDLVVDGGGEDTIITAAGDQFEGSILLQGVAQDAALDASFVF